MFTGPVVLEVIMSWPGEGCGRRHFRESNGNKGVEARRVVYKQVCAAAWVPEGSGDEAGEMQGWILASHCQAFVSFDSTSESRGGLPCRSASIECAWTPSFYTWRTWFLKIMVIIAYQTQFLNTLQGKDTLWEMEFKDKFLLSLNNLNRMRII